jgi:thioesterase domain-containing protein
LGGDGLATGYWKRPELTAEKFISDPFAAGTGARLYRTGDRCRWLPDGSIEFLGRFDDQIKLRGFRIELGEIENLLTQLPGVAQAAVAVDGTADGHKELVAFVVPHAGAELTPEAIRHHLGQSLPDHMVPARYRVAAGLPLNANGKVDRRTLLGGRHRELADRTGTDAPSSPTEHRLALLWQRILKRERIGVQENFFAVGGTSLLAMRLVHEVKQEMAHPLRLADFFNAPTIARLAQRLDRRESPGQHGTLPALQGSGSGTPLFYIPNAGGFEALAPAVVRNLDGNRYFCDSLQFPGLDGRSQPQDRIEAIASHLVACIRKMYPSGPVALSGFCFGGLVAYEVARQLEAAGQPVAALVMWDSFPRVPRRRRKFNDILRLTFSVLRRLNAEKRWFFIKHQVKSAIQALTRANRRKAAEDQIPPPALNKELSEAERNVIKASYRAIARYRPQPYSGPVLLLRTSRTEAEEQTNLVYERPGLDGWEDLLRGPVQVADFECPHLELLLEPVVSRAAETMSTYLREMDRAVNSSSAQPRG